MAAFWDHITEEQAALIDSAKVFFVASADPKLAPGEDGAGPVNVSPKGAATLHRISDRRVAYLDYPGSGNETARHALAGGPVTLMVCAFDEGEAAIVRLYGRARLREVAECEYGATLVAAQGSAMPAPRQLIELEIERTMTSCGYGVPVLEFVRERQREDRGKKYKPKPLARPASGS